MELDSIPAHLSPRRALVFPVVCPSPPAPQLNEGINICLTPGQGMVLAGCQFQLTCKSVIPDSVSADQV